MSAGQAPGAFCRPKSVLPPTPSMQSSDHHLGQLHHVVLMHCMLPAARNMQFARAVRV